MKGLLIKDLRILLGAQKTTLIFLWIFEIWFACMGMTQMALGYTVILSVFLSVGTINYDEFNHGMQFLFTLPFERKEYVREKYLFGILVGGAGAVIGFVIVLVRNIITTGGFVWSQLGLVIGAFLMGVLMLCVSLPIQLKFGTEMGRMVSMFVYGVMGMIGAIVLITLQELSVDGPGILAWLEGQIGVAAAVPGGILYLALIALSYKFSVRIVEKKEL